MTNLQLYGQQDNIFNYVANLTSSVSIQNNTPCGLNNAQINGLDQGGNVSGLIGVVGGTLGAAFLAPPASTVVVILAGLFGALDYSLHIYATHCRP